MSRATRFGAPLAGLFLMIAAGAAQQPARDASLKPTIGTAVLIGTVVDEPGGKPLRRVTVSLSSSAQPGAPRLATTDDAGRFVFTRLPAGSYSAPRAGKGGFVSAAYGEKRVGGMGTPIVLADGQRVTIQLKMIRAAVITGVVLDQGRPVASAGVSAMPAKMVGGALVLGQGSSGRATADDRGVFRIAGLAPGDYVVMTTPRLQSGDLRPVSDDELRWAQQQLQSAAATVSAGPAPAPPKAAPGVAYAPVYYPGVVDASRATLVTVAAGEERSGVDFSVQLVPTARIEGVVIDTDGQPVQTAQMNVVPVIDSTQIISDPIFLLDSAMMSRPIVSGGKFSAAGLRPGSYTLLVRAAPRVGGGGPAASGRGGPAPMTLWASADVTVDGTDQSGLQLQLQPGMVVSGRIAFDGTTLKAPEDLSRVSVRLSSAPSVSGVTVSVNIPSAQVAADGTFTFDGVTPGRYYLSAGVPGGGAPSGPTWMLKSSRVGQVDAADVPFEVRPSQNISDVVVSFTDQTSELSGTLLDAAGRPTPEFSIMVFSTDRSMWSQRSRRLRPPQRTGADGKFKFAPLPAGEYYLAALTDFEPADVYKSEFLEQVATAAMKVTLADGEKKVQDLKIAGVRDLVAAVPDILKLNGQRRSYFR